MIAVAHKQTMPIDKEQKKELEILILETVKESGLLSDPMKERIIGTPTESYSITNRRYVNLNGNVASRPKSSIASVGQHYFAVDTAIPMVFSVYGWRNGVGSIVSGHR